MMPTRSGNAMGIFALHSQVAETTLVRRFLLAFKSGTAKARTYLTLRSFSVQSPAQNRDDAGGPSF